MFKHVGTNTWPIQIIWGCMCSEQSEGKPKVWAHVYKSTKYIHRKLGTIGLRCEELKLFEQHYAGSFASHTMFWVHSYKHAHCLGCPLDIGQHSCLERNEWNSQQSRSSIKDKWLYSILTYTYRSKCPTPLGLRWPAVENTWVDWGCNFGLSVIAQSHRKLCFVRIRAYRSAHMSPIKARTRTQEHRKLRFTDNQCEKAHKEHVWT